MKTKALILLAHPDMRESNLNRHLASQAATRGDVTVHDLYRTYPDEVIDVAREQKLLREYSVVIFQFPLYWYSTPPLLKAWQDKVLLWNFAFGPEGGMLKGKFMVAVTAGGKETDFRLGEKHGRPLAEFMYPLEQTMRYCGLEPQPHFSMYESNKATAEILALKSAEYIGRIDSLLKSH